MKCEIEVRAVPDTIGGLYVTHHGAMRSEARCKTHHMTIDEPCHAGYQCPIGRIEEATEKAIAELRAEIERMRQ